MAQWNDGVLMIMSVIMRSRRTGLTRLSLRLKCGIERRSLTGKRLDADAPLKLLFAHAGRRPAFYWKGLSHHCRRLKPVWGYVGNYYAPKATGRALLCLRMSVHQVFVLPYSFRSATVRYSAISCMPHAICVLFITIGPEPILSLHFKYICCNIN